MGEIQSERERQREREEEQKQRGRKEKWGIRGGREEGERAETERRR